MRRFSALLLCGTVLLGGCRTRKPDPTASSTTVTTQPMTTQSTLATTATTLDVSATPSSAQLQDPAYWNAILATLNRIAGDAFRSAASKGAVEPSAVDALRQVYGSGVFPNEYESIKEVAAGRASGLLRPPGDVVATLRSIVKADPRCVALIASLDFGKVNPTVPSSEVVVELLPRDNSGRSVNPAPWIIEELFVIAAPDDAGRLCSD